MTVWCGLLPSPLPPPPVAQGTMSSSAVFVSQPHIDDDVAPALDRHDPRNDHCCCVKCLKAGGLLDDLYAQGKGRVIDSMIDWQNAVDAAGEWPPQRPPSVPFCEKCTAHESEGGKPFLACSRCRMVRTNIQLSRFSEYLCKYLISHLGQVL
ncbi:hypothetical protein PENSPDRAFT_198140 [Peniophora sp. CONT]|nr:hypothetical protein PENSPDRAFT_198140 [Peniophora sp. CONT]